MKSKISGTGMKRMLNHIIGMFGMDMVASAMKFNVTGSAQAIDDDIACAPVAVPERRRRVATTRRGKFKRRTRQYLSKRKINGKMRRVAR